MTFSPLMKRKITQTDKWDSREGTKITRVNLHHWAATAGAESRMVDPNANVSTNYLVLDNGDIIGQIPEGKRAWTSGSWKADAPAITIETQNQSKHVANGRDDDPSSWPVSAAAYKSVIALLADIAKRYKWNDMNAPRLRGHFEFASTSCPGGYLRARFADIRKQANAIRTGKAPAPKPPAKPAPSKPAAAPKQMKPLKGKGWEFTIPSVSVQRRIQKALKDRGRYGGPDDGAFGVESIKGIQKTIQNVGYPGDVDGIPGPLTCEYIQRYARRFGWYGGPVDRELGTFSWAGFMRGLETYP